MLVIIDPEIGAGAHALAWRIDAEFRGPCSALVAPSEPPDDGLLAALTAAPSAMIATPQAPAWLARLDAVRIAWAGDAKDAIAGLAAATPLRPRAGGGHAPKLSPLSPAGLEEGLAGLDSRWRIEVVAAPRLPHGLKAELVADIPCPTHLVGADLVRAIADVAETQDHHPTLSQAYRTVSVRVTTGEAAGRLTARDLAFAEAVDGLVAERLPAQ